ncbi:MAG: hypothetical protein GXP15_10665 [Gammaproteobacteria bacterium]|nr:hypothetical protein [Gammaproteobacteria bacterium]
MFLQRLARSIHGRDWFTVLIEVLIVVAGILIGLQVNNWNESRKSAAWEQRFLTDLAIEFQTNREQLWQVLELQKRRGSALDEVRERALHGKDARVLADVEKYYSLAMSSNRTFFPTKGVYLSALSTGSIDEVRNTNLRYAIMNIYERAYPRLVYNGEIYDERSDQVSWDGRQDFDPGDGSFTRLEYVQSQRFAANVRFLSEQNRVYLGLAESALTKLDAVILELPDSFVTADSEISAVSPASK